MWYSWFKYTWLVHSRRRNSITLILGQIGCDVTGQSPCSSCHTGLVHKIYYFISYLNKYFIIISNYKIILQLTELYRIYILIQNYTEHIYTHTELYRTYIYSYRIIHS